MFEMSVSEEKPQLVTAQYEPTFFRRFIGNVSLPVTVPLIAAILSVVGLIVFHLIVLVQFFFLFLGVVKFVVTFGKNRALLRSSTTIVLLLEYVAGLTAPVGILFAFLTSPKVSFLKVYRHLLGYRLGYAKNISHLGSTRDRGDYICRLEVLYFKQAAHVLRIRGNPSVRKILMIQHGGPGASDLLSSTKHDKFRSLMEENFVVVDYDQRSSACSGCLNDPFRKGVENSGLTVQTLVDDAYAIAKWLKSASEVEEWLTEASSSSKNSDRQIYLLGGSWGSALALRTAEAGPHLFESPIVVRGLVTNQQPESERLGYEFLKAAISEFKENPYREVDLKLLASVTGIPPGSFLYVTKQGVLSQQVPQRQLLDAYGGQSYEQYKRFQKSRCRLPKYSLILNAIRSSMEAPEFSLRTILQIKSNFMATLEALNGEVNGHPPPWAKHISGDLDVLVAQGVYDHCTDVALVQPFLCGDQSFSLDSGRKKLVSWFRKSGHSPEKEEPAAFQAMLQHVWLGGEQKKMLYPIVDVQQGLQ